MPADVGQRFDEQPRRLRSVPKGALRGSVRVPGDKSISHRALILGSLASGRTSIHGLLQSEDVLRTAVAVEAFGAILERDTDEHWMVTGGSWRTPDRVIDCGNSGTAARLLIGAAAGQPLTAIFTGDRSLRMRPMARIAEPLAAMGAQIDSNGHLPLTVRGGRLAGVRYRSPVASAQLKSAILLAGLETSDVVEVIEPTPSRDHTERMLKLFGCEVDSAVLEDGHHVRLGARRALAACDIMIPGDPSSAAFAIVAALITRNSEITLLSILDSPLRNGLIETLLEMGADISISNRRIAGGFCVMDVAVRCSELKGVRTPASRVPSMVDEYPALAIAAAFAQGETAMEGLAELRVKECDRIAATERGLRRCGIDAWSEGDILFVKGTGNPPPGGARLDAHGDHRIAMAFLLLGLAANEPVIVDSAEMIATSFPNFCGFMGSLGADIKPC